MSGSLVSVHLTRRIVGMKVDFDMQLTLLASSLYRMIAQRIGRDIATPKPKPSFATC